MPRGVACGRPMKRALSINRVYEGYTMKGPVDIPGDQLRTIIERIERIEEEIKELNEGRKEIYLEAKSNGFDVKTIRQVVRVRKQKAEEREEEESLLELYLEAIGNAASAKGGRKNGAARARSAGRDAVAMS